MVLQGPYLHISPLAQESRPGEHFLSGAGYASPKSYAWKMGMKVQIRSDIFQLAMQLSMGLAISKPAAGKRAAPAQAAVSEAARQASAELALEQNEPRLFDIHRKLKQLGRTAEVEQFAKRCDVLFDMEDALSRSPAGVLQAEGGQQLDRQSIIDFREHLEGHASSIGRSLTIRQQSKGSSDGRISTTDRLCS